MRNVLLKELKLSASVLTYLFLAFGFVFFIPGYPILCGAFFITLGIFQSFQNMRETNDILFSALLPIAKKDVVKGKYIFVCFIEVCGAVLMALCISLRMTVLSDAIVYRTNAMMNANLFALGAAFLIFGLFNLIFVGGFFKTAYKIGAPYVVYIICSFIVIGVFESLHHIPGLEAVNSFGTEGMLFQSLSLLAGVVLYVIITIISFKVSCKRFEKIDL